MCQELESSHVTVGGAVGRGDGAGVGVAVGRGVGAGVGSGASAKVAAHTAPASKAATTWRRPSAVAWTAVASGGPAPATSASAAGHAGGGSWKKSTSHSVAPSATADRRRTAPAAEKIASRAGS